MKVLSRRLEALEAAAGNKFDHLSDGEIEDRLAAIVADLRQNGVPIPPAWQDALLASPAAFGQSIRAQVKAML